MCLVRQLTTLRGTATKLTQKLGLQPGFDPQKDSAGDAYNSAGPLVHPLGVQPDEDARLILEKPDGCPSGATEQG